MALGVFQLLMASVLFFSVCDAQEWVGSKILDEKCFLFVNAIKTWDDALTSCVNMGGTLATVTSLVQWNAIKSAFNFKNWDIVWIGANKKTTGGTIVWAENNRTATELTGWWFRNNPTTFPGNDCVNIFQGSAMNKKCTDKSMFLCMEPNSAITKCTAATTTTEAVTTSAVTTVSVETSTQPPESTPTTKHPRKHCNKG